MLITGLILFFTEPIKAVVLVAINLCPEILVLIIGNLIFAPVI